MSGLTVVVVTHTLLTFQGFVVQLVCDLLDEGNTAFRDGVWPQALVHFTEGVNVALYARGEGLRVPTALLESLYINRAAAHQNMVRMHADTMTSLIVPILPVKVSLSLCVCVG